MQRELVLGCISGDGDEALEEWAVVSASKIIYVPHPLQAIPWGLAEPVPPVTTCYRDRTGESKGP
jgi:hypothetical protein